MAESVPVGLKITAIRLALCEALGVIVMVLVAVPVGVTINITSACNGGSFEASVLLALTLTVGS